MIFTYCQGDVLATRPIELSSLGLWPARRLDRSMMTRVSSAVLYGSTLYCTSMRRIKPFDKSIASTLVILSTMQCFHEPPESINCRWTRWESRLSSCWNPCQKVSRWCTWWFFQKIDGVVSEAGLSQPTRGYRTSLSIGFDSRLYDVRCPNLRIQMDPDARSIDYQDRLLTRQRSV